MSSPMHPCSHVQVANQSASVLFVWLLGSGHNISQLGPSANAVSVAANAVADVALGERYRLALLLPGVLLVIVGVVLCSSG